MVINIKWSELKLIENKPNKFIKVVIEMLPYWMEKKIEECSLVKLNKVIDRLIYWACALQL